MQIDCGHMFCKFCLDQWKKKSPKKSCPICRNNYKTEVRTFVLDNFIDQAVSKLSEDYKSNRNAIIAERQGMEKFSLCLKKLRLELIII